MANTSNMGLPIDVPSVTTGPAWATDLESMKLLIDTHTHTSGTGVQIPTAGLNINANLPFGGFGATNFGLLGLASQATTSSGTANLFYQSAGNIYWNNATGVPIQITSGSSINVASIGGITGLSGTTGAWTYSAALTTFIGTADTNKSAAIDVGAATIRQTNTANAKGITVSSPSALANDYTLTLPTGVTTSGIVAMSASGVLYAMGPRAGNFVVTNAGVNFVIFNNTKIVCGGIAGGDNLPSASFRIPANTIRDGSSFRMKFWGCKNSAGANGVVTVSLRAGTTGTTADPAITSCLPLVGATQSVGYLAEVCGAFNSNNTATTTFSITGSGLSGSSFTDRESSSAVTTTQALLLSVSLTQAGGAGTISVDGGTAEFFP